ncbi:bis(5'-nucleosyl)-tetraphosphatase (symmetrical) YqeK [Haploplasma axanthum]|uniref:bis(5'-nucleosyl)-tetraphosphatase (symmetrical) n=1 Tax=Haploplasma axanthum TaxID=29552 RepID=A0A449BE16_HAPAX|nr:bis(5'-nucleosyl)-tetraphosphatase (symmetrical) YqeK [Haploplasma axanthum]VEU80672.1 putative nicotinate-nucleotide adenylyltransferase [Haploplasma axanthum]
MTIDEIKEVVKIKYTNNINRFNHIIGVYEMAMKLANHYGVSSEEVAIAALFHDYTKYDSIDDQVKYINKEDVLKYQDTPVIYHALSASKLIKEEFHIDNELISSAISKHVWGNVKMNMTDKIVLISDKIELGRTYNGVDYLRRLAFQDIDQAIYEFLVENIEYNQREGFEIHPEQYKVVKKFKEQLDEKNK